MQFNSLEFFLFAIAILTTYWLLAFKGQTLLLLVGSYFFYGWWDYRFLSLLLISTVTDYQIGILMGRTHDDRLRKRLLVASALVNLGILATFKYYGFFVDSFGNFTESIGLQLDPSLISVAVPVGISFYTFQTMSYSFDVYRRRIEPCDSPLIFAVYVAFFPQLVAGPIERARHLLPQLQSPRRALTVEQIQSGFALVLVGLFQKVAIADRVAPVVNTIFANPGDASWVTLLIGMVGFGTQIYGDFAGYTNIARGVSRLLGIELMHNFREPYLSRNITEFWRRWHISLSNWLRDYLYIPLGGNRGTHAATYRNLMIVMLLGGLWHGAALTFVVWGGLHGMLLVLHRWRRNGEADVSDKLPSGARDLGSVVVTFITVHIAWIFFRSSSIADAFGYIGGMVRLQPGSIDTAHIAIVSSALLVAGLLDVARRKTRVPLIPSYRPVATGVGYAAMGAGLLIASGQEFSPFIYFQF